MIYSIFGIKQLIMKKEKKRAANKQPEKQDLFAIANAGRSHPSNTNHLDSNKKKPDTQKNTLKKKNS